MLPGRTWNKLSPYYLMFWHVLKLCGATDECHYPQSLPFISHYVSIHCTFLHIFFSTYSYVQTSMCVRQMIVHMCVTGFFFVFQALWGQTGCTELTMPLLVCNQPEISSKQTQSSWTETHSIHIFHLAANLLTYNKFPTCYKICGTPYGLEWRSPDSKILVFLIITWGM